MAAQQGGYLAELLGKCIATGDEVRLGERSGEIPTGCGLRVGEAGSTDELWLVSLFWLKHGGGVIFFLV